VNVLVVEDEERIASFLVKGLGSRGFDVTHVRTGMDAASAAESADVILLDLGLPDVDGLDVLDVIRQRRPHVQVIVLTARSEVGDRVEVSSEVPMTTSSSRSRSRSSWPGSTRVPAPPKLAPGVASRAEMSPSISAHGP
jgi:CheY-like chemotaxis protein